MTYLQSLGYTHWTAIPWRKASAKSKRPASLWSLFAFKVEHCSTCSMPMAVDVGDLDVGGRTDLREMQSSGLIQTQGLLPEEDADFDGICEHCGSKLRSNPQA